MKIAKNGILEQMKGTHFVTNLDSFEGNSGSPVINILTNEVIGILVAGSKDLDFDKVEQCFRYHVCTTSTCNGEIVSSIENVLTHIPEILSLLH